MSDQEKIIILGGGGHSKVLIATIEKMGIKPHGILDPSLKVGHSIFGVPVLGDDRFLDDTDPATVSLVNGIGSTKDTKLREKIYDKGKAQGFHFFSIVAKSSEVTRDVELGEGNQILSGVIIQPGCILGANVIVNTGSRVDHDCVIGAHSHIAPGVAMSGCVKIGRGVHIGVGACLIQGVEVGDGALIAAGATVYKDVPANTLVMSSASTYRELGS